MGNLHASSANPNDPRPFQKGSVEASRKGSPKTAAKEWLVDTSANISVITKDNAEQFDLIPLGGSASATTGGGGILIKAGLTMVFTVLEVNGSDRTVRCSLPIGVKPNNKGSEILGMDQLALVRAKVRWDPSAQDGDIYEWVKGGWSLRDVGKSIRPGEAEGLARCRIAATTATAKKFLVCKFLKSKDFRHNAQEFERKELT